MNSTESSRPLLTARNLKVYFELEHYDYGGVRDLFTHALSHPVEFFFRQKELLYVLDDVSFDLDPGMRLGILGVNGSGKTTLCRCLAGMMVAQQGKVEARKEVRAIFDTGTGIMPDLTGRENAYLLARLFFPESAELAPIVNDALEFSELGHFVDSPFRQYSKGMQARLLLSLLSSQSPDVLILDEVFDGADIFFQEKLAARMMRFIQNSGAAVFVSHTPDHIRRVCNKVLVLNKGKVEFLGDVESGIKAYLNLKS